MSRTVTTTVVKEYDEEGRVVKETTTTYESEWAAATVTPYVQPYVQPHQPQYPWWHHPSTTYGAPGKAQVTYTARPNTCYTINASGQTSSIARQLHSVS